MNAEKLGIAYEMKENGGEGSIIFLHGNSCSSTVWSQVFKDGMLDSKKMIRLDLPGHGKSVRALVPTQTYSIRGLATAVVELVRLLQLENIILVGHSLGGHVAIDVATQIPVKGLFIFGAPPIGKLEDLSLAFESSDSFNLLFQSILNEREASELAALFASGNFIPELVRDIQTTDPVFRGTFAQSIHPDILKDEREMLRNLLIPIAVIQGEMDPIVRTEYIKSVFVPRLWRSEIVLLNSGHSPQLEVPGEFCMLLNDFVMDVCSFL